LKIKNRNNLLVASFLTIGPQEKKKKKKSREKKMERKNVTFLNGD
jgi:hypothetical protein